MRKSKKAWKRERTGAKLKEEEDVMEFEKLQEIIAEVLNIEPEEVTMDFHICR